MGISPISLSILYLRCTHAEVRRAGLRRNAPLSILYLRCAAPAAGETALLLLSSFNSLFEMQASFALLPAAQGGVTFNSLFEMHIETEWHGDVAEILSILYLRCTTARC